MHAPTTFRAALVAAATFLATLSFSVPGLADARAHAPSRTAIHQIVHTELGPREETDDGPGVSESALAILPVETRR